MSDIELNMRLDVMGQDNSAKVINEREALALTIIGRCIHHRADYLVGGVKVPRLVVGLNACSSDTLRQLAEQLALQLRQDCIAVYHPDQGRGEHVGPGAAAWGGFSLARFQRLDEITAYGESAGFAWDQSDSDRFRAARGLPA